MWKWMFAQKWSWGLAVRVFSCPATISGKRIERARSDESQRYWVAFDLANGGRKELLVRAELYEVLQEKDRGSLTFRGKQLESFRRQYY